MRRHAMAAMDRGSDKHAPRIDEELKHDTSSLTHGSPLESRSTEAREQEGPADGEPTPGALLARDRPVQDPDALTHDEIEARAELARPLQPRVFPADRTALADSARQEGAAAELVERLERLPEGTFDHLEAVWEALGGRVEYRL